MHLVEHHGLWDWADGVLLVVSIAFGLSVLCRGLHLILVHHERGLFWLTVRQITYSLLIAIAIALMVHFGAYAGPWSCDDPGPNGICYRR